MITSITFFIKLIVHHFARPCVTSKGVQGSVLSEHHREWGHVVTKGDIRSLTAVVFDKVPRYLPSINCDIVHFYRVDILIFLGKIFFPLTKFKIGGCVILKNPAFLQGDLNESFADPTEI